VLAYREVIVTDDSPVSRRRVLRTVGIGTAAALAGCSGGENEGTDTPEEETDTPESTSVFANYAVEGTEFSVELTENSLEEISQIRVETPSGKKTTEVSSTITEYSIDILRDRAGTWFIDALDNDGEVIETAELEATFDVSVSDIGTLSQLGITGESPDYEQVNWQLTVENVGNVPIEPAEIQIVIPELVTDTQTDTIGSGSIEAFEDGRQGGVVDRDEEIIIPSGDSNSYRFATQGNAYQIHPLLFREDRANEIRGQSFQAEFIIRYQAERQNTVVPITIQMGNKVMSGSSFGYNYLQGTEIK
jgi:hypothetical protein